MQQLQFASLGRQSYSQCLVLKFQALFLVHQRCLRQGELCLELASLLLKVFAVGFDAFSQLRSLLLAFGSHFH